MTRARMLLAVALLGALAASASAATIEPLAGWAKVDQLDKAIEVAKKKGLPIVFLYAFQESDCPLHNGCARSYMREKSLAGMVRVLVYCDQPAPAQVAEVLKQVTPPDNLVPRMYIADPDLRILGFVKYKAGKDLKPIIALAKSNMKWLTKSRKSLEKANGLAEDGRYKAACKLYDNIIKNDVKRTVLVHKTWGEEADAETTSGFYFPEAKEKRDGIEKLANDRLEKARTHFLAQEYEKAKELLEPMVADGADFDAVKQAAELLKKVKEAAKKAEKEKKDEK